MNEDIIDTCRTLVALWDTMDELHYMRIHNPVNIKAFEKNIKEETEYLHQKIHEAL